MISKGFFYKFAAYLLLVLAFSNFTFANKIIYVDDDGTADFNNIQAAIDDANDGYTILVADGTYTGNGNRDIDFKGKAITVKSENGPKTCIIDCQGFGKDPHRGFNFHSQEDSNSILQGFTITGGCAEYGGAIRCNGSSPTIKNCIATNNSASLGGGISINYSKAKIIDCIIRKNIAYGAGGIRVSNLNISDIVVIMNCIIDGNHTIYFNGGILGSGGAGGGIIVSGGGGGNNIVITIINCTITGNHGYYNDGGILFNTGGKVINSIIWGNTGGFQYTADEIAISYRYKTDPRHPPAPNVSIENSLIGNGTESDFDFSYPEDANKILIGEWIHGDPCFASNGHWDPNGTIGGNPPDTFDDFWIGGDYHLKSQAGRFDPNTQTWVQDNVTSPCIDAGDPNSPIGLEPFPNSGKINMGTYGGTAEASKSYFGKPVCTTIVAGDINGDCKVDVLDFEIMLLHWLEEH
jgi:hypothetical protein